MTKTPKLSLAVTPIATPAKFRALFDCAARKWPGVKLGYVGSTADGQNHYLQQSGSGTPFIVSESELNGAGFLVDIVWTSGINEGQVGQRRVQAADRETLEFLHSVGSQWTVEETGATFRVTAHR
jgi:hypothetical protein